MTDKTLFAAEEERMKTNSPTGEIGASRVRGTGVTLMVNTTKHSVFDPSLGQAFQGDVSIIPIPADVAISRLHEIAPIDGRLILQEGEVSGHHHAVYLLQNAAQFRDDGLARDMATSAPAEMATARLYRDPTVAPELVRRRILTRSDLAIAVLVVDGSPMAVSHEEHDAILVPPGNYLIGRQVESAGAEERIVAD